MQPTIEDVEKFWNRRPCNIGHSNWPVGSREWSGEVVRKKYLVEPHIKRFAQFERWRRREVLEIGCGIGTDSLMFLNAGARLTAVDLSHESLLIAKKRCKHFGEQAGFFVLNAENMEKGFPTRFYDLVYSFGVIHHTPNPKAIIEAAFCRVKEDGEFRIMLYAKWSIKNLLRQRWEAQEGCPIVRTYTAKSIKKLLAPYFQVVSIEKTHIFPWRIKDYKEHRYKISNYYRWMPGWLFRGLEKLLGHHLLVVAKPICG